MEVTSYAEVAAAATPGLLRLAVMLTGDPHDAEDLLQATLLRAQRHADRIASTTQPTAYLRRILVNEHTSTFRALRRRVPTLPVDRIVRSANGHRTTTLVTDPGDLAQLTAAYDALPGWPESFHSCPLRDRTEYRLTFLSATRQVSAYWSDGCYYVWEVTVDGKHLAPYLDDVGGLADGSNLEAMVDRLSR